MQFKSTDLTAAWKDLIEKGLLKNIFKDELGREIEAGVKVGLEGPEAYAIEIASQKTVCEPVQRIQLPNRMEVLFNGIGKLKPHSKPVSLGKQPNLPTDSKSCSFKCEEPSNVLSILNRPFLVEALASNNLWRAYPNVAPWETRGILLWLVAVLKKEGATLPHVIQILTKNFLEDFLFIAKETQGMVTFFNSDHAGASANHLHFQSVYSDHAMAVEYAKTFVVSKYKMLEGYPASGLVFSKDVSVEELWEVIEKVQIKGYPFNLIVLESGIFLFVRNIENEIIEEFPGRAFGAINFAGLFITSEIEDLKLLNKELIDKAYKKMTISSEELEQLILS